MRIPSWLVVALSVVMALPFGYGLGVAIAYLAGGRDFGQLPAMTVPLGILAAIVFARSSWLTPAKRLGILTAGTVFLFILKSLLRG